MADSALAMGTGLMSSLSGMADSALSMASNMLGKLNNVGDMLSKGMGNLSDLLGKAAKNLILDPIMGASGALLNMFSFAGFSFPPDFSKLVSLGTNLLSNIESMVDFAGSKININQLGNLMGLVGTTLGNIPSNVGDILTSLSGSSGLSKLFSNGSTTGFLNGCKNDNISTPMIASLNNMTYLSSMLTNNTGTTLNKCVLDALKDQYNHLLAEASNYANKLQMKMPKAAPNSPICPSNYKSNTSIVQTLNNYQPDKLIGMKESSMTSSANSLLNKYKATAILKGRSLVS
jgi:hypothetical protein